MDEDQMREGWKMTAAIRKGKRARKKSLLTWYSITPFSQIMLSAVRKRSAGA